MKDEPRDVRFINYAGPGTYSAIAEQVTQTLRKGQKKSFGRQSMK